jgi:hypothetical protein
MHFITLLLMTLLTSAFTVGQYIMEPSDCHDAPVPTQKGSTIEPTGRGERAGSALAHPLNAMQ